MTNKIQSYILENGLSSFKRLLYKYADNFELSCVLDSCELNTGVSTSKYEILAAFGSKKVFTTFPELGEAVQQKDAWLFGVSSYDLKNRFEKLSSKNEEIISNADLIYFEPETLLKIDKTGEVKLESGCLTSSFWEDRKLEEHSGISTPFSPVSKVKYLDKIEEIHELIRRGEVYELNYCVPFKHTFNSFSPVRFQLDLLEKSPVPMASFFKYEHQYLCGASMERFLKLESGKLTSQPIKGTIKKGQDTEEDHRLISQLYNSEKDRAENVMIVDLVRNDLARISLPGSVKVLELFGIYSYLQVHQMISTVQSEIKSGLGWQEIMRGTFPMGSMTGAPKVAAMKQIELLEDFKRGWYSGSVGYITPDGDFDSNVVIRTLLCDMKSKIINYNAGGAITIDSDPLTEWEEVKLKTKAIYEVISS